MQLEKLMEYSAHLKSPVAEVGMGPHGDRIIYTAGYGSFEGPRLKGKLLPGGSDAALRTADGTMYLDLRMTFETDDGALIFGHGKGVWRGEPSKQSPSKGEAARYGDMYIMATPTFETGDPRYAWLNEMVYVAEGKMDPDPEEGYLARISWQVYGLIND